MAKRIELEAKADRRVSSDRRAVEERRKKDVSVVADRRKNQRRKVQRRRQIDPTTCERDYTQDEIEFMQAFDEYKRASGRMFPTCSEILEVIRALGYQKIASEPAGSASTALVGDEATGREDLQLDDTENVVS